MIAVLNLYTELGTTVTQPVGQICPGKGEIRSNSYMCNRAHQGHFFCQPVSRIFAISRLPIGGKSAWRKIALVRTSKTSENSPDSTLLKADL